LNQQVGSEGGFLVKPELMDNFLKGETSSELYQLCSRFPVLKAISEVSFPRISETSREEGSAFGGARLYFVEEAGAIISSIPKFASPTMKFKKAIGYCPVTDELLSDLPLLEKVLSNIFGQATRYTLDHCILRGSGAGEPLGIINSGAALIVAKESGQNADTIIAENIVTMLSSLPAESVNKAVWIVNPETFKELYPLAVAAGTGGVSVPLWGFKKGDEQYNTLAGLPVLPNEHCSKLGDKGDIVLADLSQYVIIEKKIRETISAHIRFEYDESAYRLVYKFDSQPLWNAPITPKHANSGEKISPFVILADRG
jgi:HK97 family phage major capsid protein